MPWSIHVRTAFAASSVLGAACAIACGSDPKDAAGGQGGSLSTDATVDDAASGSVAGNSSNPRRLFADSVHSDALRAFTASRTSDRALAIVETTLGGDHRLTGFAYENGTILGPLLIDADGATGHDRVQAAFLPSGRQIDPV